MPPSAQELERIGATASRDVHEPLAHPVDADPWVDDERPQTGLREGPRQRRPPCDDILVRPIADPEDRCGPTRPILFFGGEEPTFRQRDVGDGCRPGRKAAHRRRDIDAPRARRGRFARLADALTARQREIGRPRPNFVALSELLTDEVRVRAPGFRLADTIDLACPLARESDPTEVERHPPGLTRILLDHGGVELGRRTADELQVRPGTELRGFERHPTLRDSISARERCSI